MNRYSVTISAGPPVAIFDRHERRIVWKAAKRTARTMEAARAECKRMNRGEQECS